MVIASTSGTILHEDGDCRTRVTPASTFKLALSLIGFDSGFLKHAHDPVLTYQQGDPDWGGKAWTRPNDPQSWLRHSVVWYSQRITRALGPDDLTRAVLQASITAMRTCPATPARTMGSNAPGLPRR